MERIGDSWLVERRRCVRACVCVCAAMGCGLEKRKRVTVIGYLLLLFYA